MVDESGAWVDKKAKTKVQKSTLQPVWMESHDFQLNPKAAGFKIECFDYDVIVRTACPGGGLTFLEEQEILTFSPQFRVLMIIWVMVSLS